MGAEPGDVYTPIAENVAAYELLFTEYRTLHDYFGRGDNEVMHRLKAIQRNPPHGTHGTTPWREPRTPEVSAERAHGLASPRAAREVCALHAELTRYELVVWTAGNVSGRVPGHELMVIKPSGVSYDDLTPELMVVTDLYGTPVTGLDAAGRRGQPGAVAVVGHRGARLRVPAHAGGRGSGAHPLHLRDSLGARGEADPLRADHDG